MGVCPAGHASSADDYCDVCGLPITAPSEEPVATDASASAQEESHEHSVPDSSCPNCGVASPLNALFCENCGYDFTTGVAPRPLTGTGSLLDIPEPAAPPAEPDETPSVPSGSSSGPERGPSGGQDATPDASVPSAEWVAEIWIDPDWYAAQGSDEPMPSAGLPTVVALGTRSALIGRASRSRGITPEIDLSSDHGISRRHCQLTTDGRRWFVEDLDSSNGTFVATSTGSLPTEPIPVGRKREIAPGERVYLGAWTRLSVRKAAPGEL